MDILVRPRPPAALGRIAIAACVMLFLVVLASKLASGSMKEALVVVAVAALPALAYVASRWPIVFPFGLYVMLVPFDPLLSFVSGGGTLTKLVGIASAAALVLRALLTRRILVPPAMWLGWGAFLLFSTLSLAWSISVTQSLETYGIVASLFGLFTVLAIYPISLTEFRAIRGIAIAAGVITASYGLYAFRTTQPAFVTGQAHTERLTLSAGRIHMDPNHYAAFFLIPLAFVLVGFLTARSWLARVAYAAMFGLMAAEVSLTGSRGGFIGVAIVALVLGIRSRRYIATVVIALGGLLVSLATPAVWQRFADKTQGDGSGRNEIWATGFRAFHDYWLVGSGWGTYREAYDRHLLGSAQRIFQGWDRPAHSLVVSTAVELGLVGLALLVVAIVTTFRQNADIPRRHPYFNDRIALEAALVGLFWMALTIDVLWWKYIWLAFTLNVLLANVHRPREFLAPSTRSVRRSPVARDLPTAARARVRS